MWRLLSLLFASTHEDVLFHAHTSHRIDVEEPSYDVATTPSSIVFIHLPHTGGSTVRRGLRAMCSDQLHCLETQLQHGPLPKGRIPSPRFMQKYFDGNKLHVFFGHTYLNTRKTALVMNGRPFFFTLLRDPYEISRTGYFYGKFQNDPNVYLTSNVPAVKDSLGRIAGVRRNKRKWVSPEQLCERAKTQLDLFDFVLETKLFSKSPELLVNEIRKIFPRKVAFFERAIAQRSNVVSARFNYSLFDAAVHESTLKRFNENVYVRCLRDLIHRACSG